jgi:membrane-associated protein
VDVLTADIWSSLINGLHSLPSALIYLVVFALVFAETALFLGFIFPGETAVLVAGALANAGHANVVVVVAVVVAGAILGPFVGYLIGQRLGERLLDLPAVASRRARLERALDALRQRGVLYVFIGRFTAFLRAVMPALAGASDMTFASFCAATCASAVAWGVGYTLVGYYAAHELSHVEHTASQIALGVLASVVVVLIVRHLWLRRRERSRDEAWRAKQDSPPPS